MTTPPITIFESLPSTNDTALMAARQGAPHGSCWIADAQTKGRGRHSQGAERSWYSPPGCNLYMSCVVRPSIPAPIASRLTLVAAVALRDAIWEDSEVDSGIKWPNDLLIEGRKVAGILTEGIFDGSRFMGAVIGFGVNVNESAEDLPQDLAAIATTLSSYSAGGPLDRMRLALGVRRKLLEWVDRFEDEGLDPVLEAWRPHDVTLGRTVQVRGRQATSQGISPEGGLMVRFEDGHVVEVESGEVLFLDDL